MCVLRCALWALTPDPLLCQRFSSHPFNLKNLITVMRCFTVVERPGSDGAPEKVFARVGRISQTRHREGGNRKDTALPGLLDTLPSRMSEVFGRPNSMQDELATLAAIAKLVESYRVSCVSVNGVSSPTATWHGMVSLRRMFDGVAIADHEIQIQWWNQIPDHFRYLVSRHDPSALVVVAHWVSAFVLRAEKSGYWFLSGFADKLHSEIGDHLRSSCAHASTLVEDLSSEGARGNLTR